MRKLLLTVLSALIVLLLAGTAWADDTNVREMRTECTASEDGSCQVMIRAQIFCSPEEKTFSFPIAPNAERISVTGANYSVSRTDKYTIITLSGFQGGAIELAVNYRVAQTVTDDGDGQEFNLTLLYPDWPCAISRYSFEVSLPKAFESVPTLRSGYYGDLIDNYMDVRVEDGVIRAALNEKQVLRDHEAIRFSLELPKDYFDLRFLAGKTTATARLMFLMLLVLCVLYWVLFLRERPIPAKRQTMPPEGGNAGEVSFVLTGQKPDLALMVVQWASLGYLTITRNRRGRIWLTRQIDMGNERKDYEANVFRLLFQRSDRCDVTGDSYVKARTMAVTHASGYWRSRIFRAKGSPLLLRMMAVAAGLALCLACFDAGVAPKSWRWFAIVPLTLAGGLCCWLLQRVGGCHLRRHAVCTVLLAVAAGLFLLVSGGKSGQSFWMFLCILLQLLVGFAFRCGGPRKKAGRALASELLGYRRYLISASPSLLRGIQNEDPEYFYRNLPYADALRVGRKFAERFEHIPLEPCDWLEWGSRPAASAMCFYTRFVRLLAALRGEREPLLYRLQKRRSQSASPRPGAEGENA